MLEVKNINVNYGKARVLKDVSITVKDGEIITVIGSNGAGKSTTLKTIAGLVQPLSGEIWFQGSRIDKCSPEEIVNKGISFCMEGRRLFPFMTVVENLEMGAFICRDKDRIGANIEKAFERFPRLRERRTQKAGTLSGGEQQILAIGRALMSSPKLLLLDEPSLGLAPMIIVDIEKITRELGIATLIVEQNAQMALRLAHRGYVLQVGEIILEGDSKLLQENSFVKQAYLGI